MSTFNVSWDVAYYYSRKRLRHHDDQQHRSYNSKFQLRTGYAEGVNQGEKYRMEIVSEVVGSTENLLRGHFANEHKS